MIEPSAYTKTGNFIGPLSESGDPIMEKFIDLLNQAQDHITYSVGAGHFSGVAMMEG